MRKVGCKAALVGCQQCDKGNTLRQDSMKYYFWEPTTKLHNVFGPGHFMNHHQTHWKLIMINLYQHWHECYLQLCQWQMSAWSGHNINKEQGKPKQNLKAHHASSSASQKYQYVTYCTLFWRYGCINDTF